MPRIDISERHYRKEYRKAMKEFIKEAKEMTREELEQAYIKCKLGKVRVFTIPKSFFKDDY